MNLVGRCRPSLAATTILTALILGGCSYSPERSLTVADTAKSSGEVQAGTTKAKSDTRTKTATATKSRDGKAAGASRRVAATGTAKQSTSSHTPRRQLVASNSERECLVRAMYFESHRSSREGLLAVGTVVMNRVNSPSYPSTICGVVGQRRQFAPGVLSRPLSQRDRHYAEAAADEVLAGKRHEAIGDAMFFHVATRRYKYPNMRYLHVAGGNIFYRKVGRNAPRVVNGPVLAYAQTVPTEVSSSPVEQTVTVASRVMDKPDAAKVVTVAAVAQSEQLSADQKRERAAVPLPVPRAVIAQSTPDKALAQESEQQVAPSALEQLTAMPVTGTINYTLPLRTNLPAKRVLSNEPSTRLSYRAAGASVQGE